MFRLLTVILVGFVLTGADSTESPLREKLHRPVPGIAPTTLDEALTLTASAGGSHFQKLPGKFLYSLFFYETLVPSLNLILSIAAGAYELAGYAHIEFEFSLTTFLAALKAACLRLRNVKTHLQKAKMTELVAATGMWKFRCDNLKRDVMEQIKGMGDKMNWEMYFPDGNTPLDDVEVERHTERTLLTQAEDSPPLVERSTIERILTRLNSGGDVQEVLAKTEISTLQPPPRFKGRSLVEELITGFAEGEDRSPLLVYDRQARKWQFPDYFTAEYMENAREYKSEEVCTVLDVFTAAPEVESLDGLGGCDILYLPELNVDDPYYNPLFMTQKARDEYNREGSLDILRQVYMSHDKSSSKREESRWERIRRQLAIAAVAGGYVAHSAIDTVLDWFGYHKAGGKWSSM